MEPILLENLIAVAVADKQVLFVREEDKNNEQALGLMAICDNSMLCSFGLVQQYLKFWDLEVLEDNPTLHEYYQDRVGKTFNGEAIYNMLTEFKAQLERWEKMDNRWEFETSGTFNYKDNE